MILAVLLTGNLSFGTEDISQLYRERQIPVYGKVIRRKMKNLTREDRIKVWIYFTDKGIFSNEKYISALTIAERDLNPRSKWRRSKVRTSIVDFYDIPVNSIYIDSILSTGANLRVTSKWLNAISIEAKLSQISRIANFPFVYKIEIVLSGKRHPIQEEKILEKGIKANQPDGLILNYGNSYDQLNQINVVAAHEAGYKGQGIIVLMLDTGYYTEHEAIHKDQIIAEWDFINNDSTTQNEPGDSLYQHNHGTYTLSALGGSKDGMLYGPAFEANFILAKTENVPVEEPIEEDWYVAGLEWGESLGADVSSSSLGYIDWYDFNDLDGNTAVTTVAVDRAIANGMICVTAAGNEGTSGIIAPADADSVISVGAVDTSGNLASFSSHGPTADSRIKPEVVARGVSTYCASASGLDYYINASGTSLSTPLVGGSIAVILSAHPDWTPIMVREVLLMTADNSDNPDNLYGWGLIDVMAAINYEFLPGDVDRDGNVRVTDIVQIVRFILILDIPNEYEQWAADVNGDGSIDISDIINIINIILCIDY